MTQPKEIYCKNCRFYNVGEEQCRRRAPAHDNALTFVVPAYLQAIAMSALTIAKLNPDDFDGDIREEVTEFFRPRLWPNVKDNEWCGEFEEAGA